MERKAYFYCTKCKSMNSKEIDFYKFIAKDEMKFEISCVNCGTQFEVIMSVKTRQK